VDRVLDRLEQLYAIGATRIGASPEEDAAHRLVADWMRETELEVETDEIGNTFGRRGDGRVWVGSHLDSVPDGGRFDGVLGVVAGIELAGRLDVPLTVAAFRDEERGCGGSSYCAASGRLPAAYLELHVEQGPVLERANAPIGIVTAIAGVARGEVVFEGRADHAGTTPMGVRDDALVRAAEYVLHVARAPWAGTVATVGRMRVEPGAVNVVPARVTLSVEARAGDPAELDRLVAAIGFEPTYRAEPAAMSGAPFEALRAAAPDAPELVSGAGHDAAILAAAGVPAGMLFVRSLNGGVSHSPDELSSPGDIARGIDVLADALVRIAR
jgi:acetylornithine deacetylase/succinyl-diaminopimelate desuccinylase-like protein